MHRKVGAVPIQMSPRGLRKAVLHCVLERSMALSQIQEPITTVKLFQH